MVSDLHHHWMWSTTDPFFHPATQHTYYVQRQITLCCESRCTQNMSRASTLDVNYACHVSFGKKTEEVASLTFWHRSTKQP